MGSQLPGANEKWDRQPSVGAPSLGPDPAEIEKTRQERMPPQRHAAPHGQSPNRSPDSRPAAAATSPGEPRFATTDRSDVRRHM